MPSLQLLLRSIRFSRCPSQGVIQATVEIAFFAMISDAFLESAIFMCAQ